MREHVQPDPDCPLCLLEARHRAATAHLDETRESTTARLGHVIARLEHLIAENRRLAAEAPAHRESALRRIAEAEAEIEAARSAIDERRRR